MPRKTQGLSCINLMKFMLTPFQVVSDNQGIWQTEPVPMFVE